MEAPSLVRHNRTLNGPADHGKFSGPSMAKWQALMSVIWLNGTIGSGKSAVGEAIARLVPCARYLDGDDYVGPESLPNVRQWRMAVDALLRSIIRRGHFKTLVIAHPLDVWDYRRLRAACRKARRGLLVVNLAPPLNMVLRGRGGRLLEPWERDRVRVMRSQGYYRRHFASLTLPNVKSPPVRTARRVLQLCNSHSSSAAAVYPLR
jgi:hypothetical protein